MNGEELKTFAESVLDGVVIEDDFFYQLLNIAKTKLEEKRLWEYLKKLNSAYTASSNLSVPFPDDLAEDYKILIGTNELLPVPFEQQQNNISGRYYMDFANETINLLGTIQSAPLYIFYKRFTPAIAEATSPVFPARFHPLLGFYVAAYYQSGIDADDIFARMAPVNRSAAMELQSAMEAWDTNISIRSQDGRVGVANSSGDVPLELM